MNSLQQQSTFSRVGFIGSREEMVVGRSGSDLLQSPSKLMLGKGGIDLLMQTHDAHNLFVDMSPRKVIWDEEIQHRADQRGLLKELARVGCHTGDNKFMFKAPVALNRVVHEVPSQVVWDEELLQSPHSEDDLLLLLSEPATIAEHVEFMDQVTSSGDAQEVFDGIHSDREAISPTDEAAFNSCKVSECAAIKGLNKMPLPDVVWDEEPQHGPKPNVLVLQLASGEEMLHNASKNAGLLQKLASGSNDLDTHKKLLQQLVWDDELLHSLNSQDDLLQHLATCEERKVNTESARKVNTESALNDLLTPVNDQFSLLATGVDSMHDVFIEMQLENDAIMLTKQFESMDPATSLDKKQHPNQSWDQFVQSVHSYFSLYDYSTVVTMLLECKQDGTIKEFATQDVEMVWGEEQLHGLDLQAGLLHQGAEFNKYWVGEKRILVAEPTKDDMFLNQKHLQTDKDMLKSPLVFEHGAETVDMLLGRPNIVAGTLILLSQKLFQFPSYEGSISLFEEPSKGGMFRNDVSFMIDMYRANFEEAQAKMFDDLDDGGVNVKKVVKKHMKELLSDIVCLNVCGFNSPCCEATQKTTGV